MHYLAIILTGSVIGTLCLLLLNPRYRAKCQLTMTRVWLRTSLMTMHGEHYVPNLPKRLGSLDALADSYIDGETVRLQHLASILKKANKTLLRAFNYHPQRFDLEILEAMVVEYCTVVTKLADVERIRDKTIHERRCEYLYQPVVKALGLLCDERIDKCAKVEATVE